MPDSARLEELGLPLHVIVQGVGSSPIFMDDWDRAGFVLRATRVFGEMAVDVLAWSLMDRHARLIVRPRQGRISKAMQRVLGPHAQAFNRRHELVGYCFRDRFWSRPVEDMEDLRELIVDVLLDPVRRAGVSDLAALMIYRWTSLVELSCPCARCESFVNRKEALAPFGDDELTAVTGLLSLLSAQLAEGVPRPDASPLASRGARPLSDRQRKDLQLMATLELRQGSEKIDGVLRGRETIVAIRLRLRHLGWTLPRVVERAAKVCRVSARALRCGRRSRAQSRARALAAHFAGRYLGCQDAEIGGALGVTRQSAIHARHRGGAAAESAALTWRKFFQLR